MTGPTAVEMVKFCKDGSHALDGAVRLAIRNGTESSSTNPGVRSGWRRNRRLRNRGMR